MTLSPRSVRILNLTALVFGIATCGLLVHEIGWDISRHSRERDSLLTAILAFGILATETLRLIGVRTERRKWRSRVTFLAIPFIALLEIFFSEWLRDVGASGSAVRSLGLFLLAISQLTLVGDTLLRFVRLTSEGRFRKIPPALLVVGTFLLAILIGAGLLMTPNATTRGIGWIDALFTSTSAVCVTGLATLDTSADFTFTGQAIILALIQIGGLGVMTLAYFLTVMSGQGIGLRDRALLGEILSESNIHQVGRVVSRIVGITVISEGIGTLLLYLCWRNESSLDSPFWQALFHAISAFCNAGFSTLSAGMMNPVAIDDHAAQSVIMALIIIGGLGFVVAGQIHHVVIAPLRKNQLIPWRRTRHQRHRVPVHVRLVLITTTALLVGGAVGFWVLDVTLKEPAGRVWTAVFNSVTARTAGFNVSDMGALPASAVVLMCFLMVIGGSPGGTAGGVRTTTFALSLLELQRLVRGRSDVHFGGRRMPRAVMERCHVTIFLSLLWILVSTLFVAAAQPRMHFDDVLFECVSAFATVGLSRGITAELGTFSQIVIMLSMLIGRIGILTFAFTLAGSPRPHHYRYPEARLPLN
ncbi:TrkH family potassium uptake protein [Haloferula sargassicola]|uniref:Ktr system potassium uptake protein B n=1 Tax=Haloferula sargassicola TaxID=490096 RepID=A0ABP9UPQ4_9BACT